MLLNLRISFMVKIKFLMPKARGMSEQFCFKQLNTLFSQF
jgi:hypothetical protein